MAKTAKKPPQEPLKRLGKNIQHAMVERDTHQVAIATRTGISRITLSRLIHGHTDPHLSTLKAIADDLGVTLCDLLKDC